MSSVAAAPRSRCAASRRCRVSGRSRGTSPFTHQQRPLRVGGEAPRARPARHGRCRAAGPGGRRQAAARERGLDRLRLVADHDRDRVAADVASTVRRTCSSRGTPRTGWRTLARALFIRVPLPAARMTACTGRESPNQSSRPRRHGGRPRERRGIEDAQLAPGDTRSTGTPRPRGACRSRSRCAPGPDWPGPAPTAWRSALRAVAVSPARAAVAAMQ